MIEKDCRDCRREIECSAIFGWYTADECGKGKLLFVPKSEQTFIKKDEEGN